MQSLLDLHLLVDKYAEILPHLALDGDKQEEYSTMLLWLQNQVEGGTPNPRNCGSLSRVFVPSGGRSAPARKLM